MRSVADYLDEEAKKRLTERRGAMNPKPTKDLPLCRIFSTCNLQAGNTLLSTLRRDQSEYVQCLIFKVLIGSLKAKSGRYLDMMFEA